MTPTDLDQLIRDADPARGLDVRVPGADPITAGAGRTPRRRAGGYVAVAGTVLVVVVVGAVALSVRGHKPAQPPGGAFTGLPFGTMLYQAGPTGVRPGSAHVEQVVPDTETAPAWGLRTYQTQSGMTCLQVGRSESGQVGAIGEYGAFRDDGRFHPFSFSDLGLGECAPNDAHDHAFLNVGYAQVPANAAQEPCNDLGPTQNPPACGTPAVRDVYFGLLGPEATGITYVGADGRERTEATHGPDGAYLVVRPVVHGSCLPHPPVMSTCGESVGIQSNAVLRAGEITAVRYRDGHVCRLPAPEGLTVRFGSCPVVGYVPPPGPRYTEAQVATPVTVRALPARQYCDPSGPYRPQALPIPCDRGVPPGYVADRGEARQLLVYVSFIARAPVRDVNDSAYVLWLRYPGGCNTGGEGSGTGAIVRAGERVTRPFFASSSCRGTYTGRVEYIPNLGPNGPHGQPLVTLRGGGSTLFVGRFSFRVR